MVRYKEKINAKGLKMKWIADKIGIPQSTLSCYLSGTRTMPDSVENKLKILLR